LSLSFFSVSILSYLLDCVPLNARSFLNCLLYKVYKERQEDIPKKKKKWGGEY